MKRIRRLIVLTIAGLITVSFFGEYAATATAPGVRDDSGYVGGGLPNEMAKRRSFIDQVFKPTPQRAKDIVSKMSSSDQGGIDTLSADAPTVVSGHRIDTPAGLANDQITNQAPAIVLPAPDGNYCDPNYVGQPLVFNQMVELTMDDLLTQIHNRFGVNFLMGPKVRNLPINIKAGALPWNVL